MEIHVQFVKMPINEAVHEMVTKKLNKLAKKYNWLINAKVIYKQEKDPKGKGKYCEIQLSHTGPRIFAFSNEESFEVATKETISDIKKLLAKRKGEMKPYM